jgi:hypothetical protein
MPFVEASDAVKVSWKDPSGKDRTTYSGCVPIGSGDLGIVTPRDGQLAKDLPVTERFTVQFMYREKVPHGPGQLATARLLSEPEYKTIGPQIRSNFGVVGRAPLLLRIVSRLLGNGPSRRFIAVGLTSLESQKESQQA